MHCSIQSSALQRCPSCRVPFKNLAQHISKSKTCSLARSSATKNNMSKVDEGRSYSQLVSKKRKLNSLYEPGNVFCRVSNAGLKHSIVDSGDQRDTTNGAQKDSSSDQNSFDACSDFTHMQSSTKGMFCSPTNDGSVGSDHDSIIGNDIEYDSFNLDDIPGNGEQPLCDSHSSYDSTLRGVDDVVNDPTDEHQIPQNCVDDWEPFLFPISSVQYDIPFTIQERSLMRIYVLLRDSRTPRCLFDKLMKVFKEECSKGFDPSTMTLSRASFVRRMAIRFPGGAPISRSVGLENKCVLKNVESYERTMRDVTFIPTFDFKHQLLDLLNDHDLFGNLSNLQIDIQNPWGRCKPAKLYDGRYPLDDVHSGKWYQDTYDAMIKDSTCEMLCPIILYVDKTGTDKYNRFGLEPVIFTTTLLNRGARNKTSSWRILGYIPAFDQKSSASKERERSTRESKGRSMRNYHTCMSAVLKSLVTAQQQELVTFLRIGERVKKTKLKIPVAYVIGDAKSQDHLCLRYNSYDGLRTCRACNCSFEDLDNEHIQCRWLSASSTDETIDKLINCDLNPVETMECYRKLQAFCVHKCYNSFREVNLGINKCGILGATPTDLMHAFLEGVLKYSLKVFVSMLKPKQKEAIDHLVDEMFGSLRSSQKEKYPRLNFTNGITNLTFLTAEEWLGVSVCFLIITVSQRGQAILKKVYPPELNKEDEPSSTPHNVLIDSEMEPVITSNDFYEVWESLISFGDWYKHGAPFPWCSSEKKHVKTSIATMLNMVRSRLPRTVGNGWKLQKFHELLHVPRNMHLFGSPANYDTGPCENALIYFAKAAASTAQKRSDNVFQEQCALRVYESQLMEKALKRMKRKWNFDNYVEKDHTISLLAEHSFRSQLHGSPWYKLLFCDGNHLKTDPCQNSLPVTTKGYVEIHPSVFDGLKKYLMSGDWCDILGFNIDDVVDATYNVHLFSEYHRGNNKFRAHPNYRSEGSWYDWVLVKFHVDGMGIQYYPSKILTFFTIQEKDTMDSSKSPSNKGALALIHSCESKDSDSTTAITERWNLEYETKHPQKSLQPVYRVVSVDTFGEAVYVIEEQPGLRQCVASRDVAEFSQGVILLKEREHWRNQFT